MSEGRNPLVAPIGGGKTELRVCREVEGELLGVGYVGTVVTRVLEGKLGERSGLRKGMHLHAINGAEVEKADEVKEAFASAPREFIVVASGPDTPTPMTMTQGSNPTMLSTQRLASLYTLVDCTPPFDPTHAALPLLFSVAWTATAFTFTTPTLSLIDGFRLVSIVFFVVQLLKLHPLSQDPTPDRSLLLAYIFAFAFFALTLGYLAADDFLSCRSGYTLDSYEAMFTNPPTDCPPFAFALTAAFTAFSTVASSLYCSYLFVSWYRTPHVPTYLENPALTLPPSFAATQHNGSFSESMRLIATPPPPAMEPIPPSEDQLEEVLIGQTSRRGSVLLEKVTAFARRQSRRFSEGLRITEIDEAEATTARASVQEPDMLPSSNTPPVFGEAAAAADAATVVTEVEVVDLASADVVEPVAPELTVVPATPSLAPDAAQVADDNELWDQFLGKLRNNHLSIDDVKDHRRSSIIVTELGFSHVEAVRVGKLLKRTRDVPPAPELVPRAKPWAARTLSAVAPAAAADSGVIDSIPDAHSSAAKGFSTNELLGMKRLVAQDYARIRVKEPKSVSDVLRAMEARKKLLSYNAATSFS